MWTLSGLVICVFIATALTLARVLPAPHKPLDYVVIGAVSVLLSLSALFAAVLLSTQSSERLRANTGASSDPGLRM